VTTDERLDPQILTDITFEATDDQGRRVVITAPVCEAVITMRHTEFVKHGTTGIAMQAPQPVRLDITIPEHWTVQALTLEEP
jgi:hypothetical protein